MLNNIYGNCHRIESLTILDVNGLTENGCEDIVKLQVTWIYISKYFPLNVWRELYWWAVILINKTPKQHHCQRTIGSILIEYIEIKVRSYFSIDSKGWHEFSLLNSIKNVKHEFNKTFHENNITLFIFRE